MPHGGDLLPGSYLHTHRARYLGALLLVGVSTAELQAGRVSVTLAWEPV